MPVTLIIHLTDQDPVVGEVEELPDTSARYILISNPRMMDGKDLHFVAPGIVELIWPLHRINFIEIVPTDEEEIIGFVRE